MAEDDEAAEQGADTHRVEVKRHVRTNGWYKARGLTAPQWKDRVFEVGETIRPSERELDRFGFKFAPLDPGTDGGEAAADEQDADEQGADESTGDETEAAEQEAAEDETGERDDGAQSEVPPGMTVEAVVAAKRDRLRAWATEFRDVNGNWGTDRLRAELKQKATED